MEMCLYYDRYIAVYKMKEILFLVLWCVIFVLSVKASREDEINTALERYEGGIKECLALHESVTGDELRSLLTGKGGGSSEANCALACVLKKMEGIEVDSETKQFKKDVIIERVTGALKDHPKELKIALEGIESCTQEVAVGDDECETVAALVQCMVKACGYHAHN